LEPKSCPKRGHAKDARQLPTLRAQPAHARRRRGRGLRRNRRGARLAGRRPGGRELEILVVDRQNYHLFAPLLYQVAAAEITPEQIAYPIRSIFRNDPDVQALAAEVQGIDREERILQTNRGPVPYDWLVIATGSKTHWFGVPGAAEFSYGLKSLDDARELRNHVLACVERAASEQDPETRKRLLSFVIVGGGPTGVEFAGALAVLFRGPLPKDYPELDLRSEARIVLAEAGPRPLPGMSESASREAVKRLEKLGVEVRCGAMVEEIAARHVQIRGGESILADTTVWTAGVQGDPQARNWGLKSEKGRVLVEPQPARAGRRAHLRARRSGVSGSALRGTRGTGWAGACSLADGRPRGDAAGQALRQEHSPHPERQARPTCRY
jgi:NADH dehydrogenase